MLTALLDNIYGNWVKKISLAKGNSLMGGFDLDSRKIFVVHLICPISCLLMQERKKKILKTLSMKEYMKFRD